MPDDSNHLFKIFSECLFDTETRSKEVKFSLTNYIQNHEAEISQLLKKYYPENFGIEAYISNLMVGSYDFEITLSLLSFLNRVNVEISFESFENFSPPEDLIEELILIDSDHNLMKFSILQNEDLLEFQDKNLVMPMNTILPGEEDNKNNKTAQNGSKSERSVAYQNGAILVTLINYYKEQLKEDYNQTKAAATSNISDCLGQI